MAKKKCPGNSFFTLKIESRKMERSGEKRRNKNLFEEIDHQGFLATPEELEELVRSKKFTSRGNTVFQGQSGGTRYLPWCFTESGIYILMTVLKGELATQQSKALIRIFHAMKDYIIEMQGLAS